MGFYCKSQTGEFVTASSTNGFAMIKIALGDGKKDAGNTIFFDKSNPYYQRLPDTYTFAQKDSIWKERAKPGLKEKWFSYMLQMPNRMIHLYKLDSHFIPSLIADDSETALHSSKDKTKAKIKFIFYNTLYSLVYYITIIVFAISLYIRRKEIMTEKGLLLLALIIMTCIFSVIISEYRYHYPCIFLICIWAAFGIDGIFIKHISHHTSTTDS